MKQISSNFLFLILALLFVLPACSSDDDKDDENGIYTLSGVIIGTWEVSNVKGWVKNLITGETVEMNNDFNEGLIQTLGKGYIQFDRGGKGYIFSENESDEFSWSVPSENQLTIKGNGDAETFHIPEITSTTLIMELTQSYEGLVEVYMKTTLQKSNKK